VLWPAELVETHAERVLSHVSENEGYKDKAALLAVTQAFPSKHREEKKNPRYYSEHETRFG